MPQVDVESGDGPLDTPSRVTDGRRVDDDPSDASVKRSTLRGH